ncbi:TIGR04086 family membrane protein [Bacillus massilinigeriensis]|uniref:TIGR04086 family membrane protein n=1 Tax=Bacillus mediterraneensis TaxID=1805474 RepID=UPI0008F952C2|nr:TIGR04086 family membrane protein [Bacillus mediterraneensis]
MESRNMGVAVLYGLGIIFSLAIIGSLVFSLLLRFTAIQENSLQYIVTTISFIALFVGGFITGGKGKQKGWLLGGVTGGTYTLLVLLFQYLGYDSLFSMEQMVYHVCYIITAMMGGILGVNMTSGKN